MINLKKTIGITLSLTMILACAEDGDGTTEPTTQAMMDGQTMLANDSSPDAIDISQAPEPLDDSGGSGGNETDAQPLLRKMAQGHAKVFRDAFYRQAAERFAGYEMRQM